MNYKNNSNYVPVKVKRGKGTTTVYQRKPSTVTKNVVNPMFDIEQHKDLQFGKEIADKFAEKGVQIFLVGGGVRDFFSGSEIDDFDFCTASQPETVKEIAEDIGSVWELGGEEHGTIAFNYGQEKIEVTTFRTETYEGDRSNPNVTFINNIDEDLKRRDFTMNAMAIDFAANAIIDPYSGKQDLEQKILRTPGEPYDRLNEDPLRVDRAIRFCSRDGFRLEPELETAIIQIVQERKLQTISRERHTAELKKINVSKGAMHEAVLLAARLGAFPDMFDRGIKNPYELAEHMMLLDDPENRLVAILLAGGDAKRMKLENKYEKIAQKVVDAEKLLDAHNEYSSYLLVAYRHGKEPLEYLADLGDIHAINALKESEKYVKSSDSYVKGGTITQLGEEKGLKPGPWINTIKNEIDEMYIASEGQISENEMIAIAKNKISSLQNDLAS